MQNKKILFIVTSHKTLGDRLTGIWFEELSTPYYAFQDAGYEVDIASIHGGPAPIDPVSIKRIGDNLPSVDRFLLDKRAQHKLQETRHILEVDSNRYAAIFLPGGHGTMWDLPKNETLAQIVSQAMENNQVLAAVCHGSAGLLTAKNKLGEPVVKGRTVNSFTDEEEKAVGLEHIIPFLLETQLRELGAHVKTGPNFDEFAVRDKNLITGQNPASSLKVAQLALEALAEIA